VKTVTLVLDNHFSMVNTYSFINLKSKLYSDNMVSFRNGFQESVRDCMSLSSTHWGRLYNMFKTAGNYGDFKGDLPIVEDLIDTVVDFFTGLAYAMKYDVAETAIRHPKLATGLMKLSGTDKHFKDFVDYLQATMDYEYRKPIKGLIDETHPLLPEDRQLALKETNRGCNREYSVTVYRDGNIVINEAVSRSETVPHIVTERSEAKRIIENDHAAIWFVKHVREVPWGIDEIGEKMACRIYSGPLDKILDFAFGSEKAKPEMSSVNSF